MQGAATIRQSSSLRRILVCLDGSPFGSAALRYAMTIARAHGAKLYLLEVLECSREGHPRPVDPVGAEIARAEASDYLHDVARQVHDAGLEVRTRVAEGRPAEQIIRVAEREEVDLIVLGTHGIHEALAFRLGGTSHRVAHHSPRSLLLVGSEPGPTDGLDGRISKLLVLLDGSPSAEAALLSARELAVSLGAELVLCSLVVRPALPVSEPLSRRDHELLRGFENRVVELTRGYLRRTRHDLIELGIEVRCVVEAVDDLRQAVIDIAEAERVDVILIASHGRTSSPCAVHGSLAHHLLVYSTRPVWVVQNRPGLPEEPRPDHRARKRGRPPVIRSSPERSAVDPG